jgi:DNA-binding transcriptional ArsR family regulator
MDRRQGGDAAALARLLRHPLRQRLLFEYADAVTSPSRVAAALGERLNVVSYHTGVLLRAGAIELVRTVPRRGGREHFYRTRIDSRIEDDEWERLPQLARRALVRLALDVSWSEAEHALVSGGMDEPTAHVSRSFLSLDERGAHELARLLRAAIDSCAGLERESEGRAAGTAEPYEVIVLAFRRRASGP